MVTFVFRYGFCLLLALSAEGCLSSRSVLPIGDAVSKTQGALVEKAPLHVISWNVHKAGDERFVEEVKDLLAGFPREQGVILCLQEVRSSTCELIKDSYGDQVYGHYTPSWRFPFSKRSTGVMTIANSGLVDSSAQQLLSPGREFVFVSPKVSLRSSLPLPRGEKLQIINCHGLNFVSKRAFAKQLDQIFASLQNSREPVIVCGDFNVWSEGRLALLREKAQQVGLVEAVNQNPGKAPAPGWIRGLKGVAGFDPGLHLDRIFSRGVEVRACYSVEGPKSSDHLPTVLKFRVAFEE